MAATGKKLPVPSGSRIPAAREAELVARALDGSDEGFLPLYQQYFRYVRWIVGRVLKDPGEVEDCAQEVWIKVRKKLGDFEGRSGFRSWLSTVATNHARDLLRAKDKQRRALQAAVEVYRYERVRAQDAPLDERHGPLLRALDGLDSLQRGVVEQRLANPGCSLESIGTTLDVPRHKVKYAWKTALDKLRQRLGEWATTEGALALVALLLRRIHG